MDKDQLERYARHIILREVGGQGQQKLLAAKVLVVGAGGLGAPILQYLAAAGVGEIGIADDDVVSLSNLQRQVIYRTDQVGIAKTTAAGAFVSALNPDVVINQHTVRISQENSEALIAPYDLIIEGVDNFETRFSLNAACIALRKPFISAAVGRFDGQIALYKPFAVPGELPCYRCLTPAAPPRDAQISCAEDGVLGVITGVVGSIAALEALKELLGIGETLAGHLLLYDGFGGSMRRVKLRADPACMDCGVRK